ncbi:MAG TPA: PAS domain-containing protein, partial [Kofleriaceae bacterium]|nr:PAS domain-containing protein [Kofleriaceae bacterium]
MAESPLADLAGLRAAARQVSLLRLLLLSIALAVLALALQGRRAELVETSLAALRWLLFGVALVSAALVLAVGLVRRAWQLALHLVFDLAWSGLFIHWSGGIDSPGVVILYAVILVGTLTLPGVVPFVLPSLASLVLAGSVALHLASRSFEPGDPGQVSYDIADTNRVLGTLATQIAALFLVDLLGQLLARRLHEQRLFTGEMLDQLGEGVIGIDRSGTVAYANDEAIRLLGLDPRQPPQGRRVDD